MYVVCSMLLVFEPEPQGTGRARSSIHHIVKSYLMQTNKQTGQMAAYVKCLDKVLIPIPVAGNVPSCLIPYSLAYNEIDPDLDQAP